jgi:hypothetical protein
MSAGAQEENRSQAETELVARLIVAAHESTERRLTQAEVDTILGVAPPVWNLSAHPV